MCIRDRGWDTLWKEKYKDKIYMFDNPRDAFGIALIKLCLLYTSRCV